MSTLKRRLLRGAAIAVGSGFAIGLAGAALGIGIAHADAAHATHGTLGDKDGEMYALDLQEVDEGMLGLESREKAIWSATERGTRVCQQRQDGKSEDALIDNMVHHGWVPSHANVLVRRAEFHFCPQYLGG